MEIDEEKYRRNLRIRRGALFTGVFVVVGGVSVVAADLALALGIFDEDTNLFVGVWLATSSLFLAICFYVFAAISVMRFRRAEPRRISFGAACMEYEQIDTWRRVRCDATFWSERLDDAGFELEAAELLAGHLRTGQVMLTRAANDYGVDVLVCSPLGRIVVQCKQWKGLKSGAAQVRALAGAKAFFAADYAILMSLDAPSEDREQCESFAASQKLEFWNLEAILDVAVNLRNGGSLIA